MVFQLPLQLVSYDITHVVGRFKTADILQELVGQLRQLNSFHFGDRDLGLHTLSSQAFILVRFTHHRFTGDCLSLTGSAHGVSKTSNLAIAENESILHGAASLFQPRQFLVSITKHDIDGDEVICLDRTIVRIQVAIAPEQVICTIGDILIRVLVLDPLQLQTLPLRHFKFGPDFDVEFKSQRAIVFDLDRVKIKLRFGDCREVFLITDLRHGVHDQ